MKLIINTAHQRFGGAVQVALSFIHECRRFSEHEYHVWVGPGVGKSLVEADFPVNFHFYHFDFGVINFRVTWVINRTLQKKEKEIQPDVIIATSGPSYFRSTAPQIIGFNLPLYIYPESPYVQNWTLGDQLKMWMKKQLHFYFFKRDASAYVVQTEDVNKRVSKALSTEKVYTVTNNHSSFYHPIKKYAPKLPKRVSGEIRLITISSWYPHKHLDIIPAVARELIGRGYTKIKFIVTLPDYAFQKLLADAVTDTLINVGPVKPQECPSLYEECDIMFLPTLAECFSASYPEAMVMEKPIVTTDLGFARSICGSAALYFAPIDVESAADKIEMLINDSELRTQLISEGKKQLGKFDTAEERAAKYLRLCQQLTDDREK